MLKTAFFRAFFYIILIFIPIYASAEWQSFPQSFNFKDFKIEVAKKKLRVQGSYQIFAAVIKVQQGSNTNSDSFELPGDLRSASVTDLDNDNHPEITLNVRVHGSTGKSKLILYEFQNGEFKTVEFPPLSKTQQKNYAGFDEIKALPALIIRRYQHYSKNDQQCCPTGPKFEILYGYSNDKISVESSKKIN